MQITFLILLITFTITSVTADIDIKKLDVRLPVHRPEETDDRNPDNVNVLLTTLFEMHHNLLAQISILEDMLKTALPTKEKSEIKHMVQHYTAQKNNIEFSIQQIQSNNDGLDISKSRSSEKDLPKETKSIPILVNLFKRTQTPATEQTNANVPYSLPYQPHYEPQPAVPTYIYQTTPPGSVSNDPSTYQNNQLYLSGDQSPLYYQDQSNQQTAQAFPPNSQIVIQPQVQPTYTEPQYQPQLQSQQQVHLNPQTNQQFVPSSPVMVQPEVSGTLPEAQYQPQLQVQPQPAEQQLQPQIIPQFPPLQQQIQPQQQIPPQQQIQPHQLIQPHPQIQPQQQIQPQPQPQPQQQYAFDTIFKPSSVPVRRPQVPDYDTQRYQSQSPFGQKEGIFVYYPNGMITDDKDRPTIGNRFNQAIDRFGQVISNLGNWQQTNPTNENGLTSVPRAENLPVKEKIKRYLKISSQQKSKIPMGENTKSTSEMEIKQEK